MTDGLILKAYGKVNLGLDVVGLRDDGYHLVRMVMQSVDLYDELKMSVTDEDAVSLTCDRDDLLCDDSNLVCRAVNLMKKEYGITKGFKMELKKRIPVAAGMAGGSTDCAAALKGVNTLMGLGLSDRQLMEEGVKLGADVPYCIMGGTALAEGIGEVLTPLRGMPRCGMLLAKPAVLVSTQGVYKKLDRLGGYVHPDIDGMIKAVESGDLEGICKRLGNVLEEVTLREHPDICDIKDAMLAAGAMGTLMSGSGPTVFGIFKTPKKAAEAAAKVKERCDAKEIYAVTPV